jgi:hypothetical protein
MTKLKARISRVGPEKKRTFQRRPHTNLKTMEHVTKFGWTVLSHPPDSPDLAPSDFPRFGQRRGPHGQHFPHDNAVIMAEREWVAFTSAACMLMFFTGKTHSQWWWPLCGTIVFCNWKVVLSNGIIVHPLFVVVSMEKIGGITFPVKWYDLVPLLTLLNFSNLRNTYCTDCAREPQREKYWESSPK